MYSHSTSARDLKGPAGAASPFSRGAVSALRSVSGSKSTMRASRAVLASSQHRPRAIADQQRILRLLMSARQLHQREGGLRREGTDRECPPPCVGHARPRPSTAGTRALFAIGDRAIGGRKSFSQRELDQLLVLYRTRLATDVCQADRLPSAKSDVRGQRSPAVEPRWLGLRGISDRR
jgi:hypothetical protein